MAVVWRWATSLIGLARPFPAALAILLVAVVATAFAQENNIQVPVAIGPVSAPASAVC